MASLRSGPFAGGDGVDCATLVSLCEIMRNANPQTE